MKKVGLILTIVLIVTLALSVFACNNNSNTPPPSNNTNDNTNDVGFISDTTSIEELSEDLVKCFLNTAKTAGTSRLSTSNPLVSWKIDMDVRINEIESVCTFEINYDHRDKSKTEMKLLVVKKGETDPFVSLFYFQDQPSDDRNPGNLYFQYGDAKVKVPVSDTFLGELFPISFNDQLEDILDKALSTYLFTLGDIQYKYKDGTDGKRTRNYVLNVDLKKTLVNIVKMMDAPAFKDLYGSVSWIIESLFGVSADKIGSDLPETIIKVDVTTTGGHRTFLGMGAVSNFKIDASVAASDNKDTIFRGESYNITLDLKQFKASNKLIEDFPKEDSSYFDNYLKYDQTALVVNGALVYLEDETKKYDITIGFCYDGLSESQNKDEVKIVVTEEGKPENVIVEFYAFDNIARFNFYCKKGDWVELEFNFDFDYFIEYMIDLGSEGDSLGLLKTIAYALGAIQVWEDDSLSLNIDAEFYHGVLNLDIASLVKGLEDSCNYAGGSSTLIHSQLAEHDLDLPSLLRELVIEKEIVLIFDNGNDSINTTDDLIDKSRFIK